MTVYDIGAHIGIFALGAGFRVGRNGKVLAFEPAPEFGTFDMQYLLGLAAVNERMLILLDIERLMSSAEMALIEQSAA